MKKCTKNLKKLEISNTGQQANKKTTKCNMKSAFKT